MESVISNANFNYTPCDEQVYRRPAIRQSDMLRRLNTRAIEEIIQDNDVQAALEHSLPSKLNDWQQKIQRSLLTPQDRRQIEKTLRRMSSRPTPFKTLAGVGVSPTHQEYESRVVELPAYPTLGPWLGINPTCRWAQESCTLITPGHSTYEVKQFRLPPELAACLKALPRRFKIEVIKKELRLLTGQATRGEVLLRELQEFGIVIPLAGATLFSSVHFPTNHLEKVLVFGTSPQLYARTEVASLADLSVDLMSINAARRSKRKVGYLWPQAQRLLDAHFDHGPVPLLHLTPQLIGPYRTTEQLAAESHLDAVLLHRASLWRGKIWDISDDEWSELKSFGQANRHPPAAVASLTLTDDKLTSIVLLRAMANSASKVIGRFATHHPQISALVKKIHLHEASTSAAQLVEVEIRPARNEFLPLLQRHSFLRHFIDITGTRGKRGETIHRLAELAFVRDRNGAWQLMSTASGAVLHPCLTHVLNADHVGHFYYQLLASFIEARNFSDTTWDWGAASALCQLPRVVRRGVILSLASWQVIPTKAARATPQETLKQLRAEIPAEIFLLDGDKRLPLNTASALFEVEFHERMKRGQTVFIEENLFGGRDQFEVVSFGLRPGPSFPAAQVASDSGPSGSFLNFRVFVDPTTQGLLLESLGRFLSSRKHVRRKSELFFLLFPLPTPHIRLRVGKGAELNAVQQWLEQEMTRGTVLSYSRHNYEPEVHRWGGPQGIALYESLSVLDCQLKLSDLGRNHNSAVSLTLFWLEFFLSRKDQRIELLLLLLAVRAPGLPGPHARAILQQFLPAPQEIELSVAELELRKRARSFLRRLPKSARQEWLGGFLHHHCNRIYGIQTAVDERLVYKAALRALKASQ